MQEYRIPILVLLLLIPDSAQTAASDWKVVRDSKGSCQISVPPEWTLLAENTGAAILQDATTAIAVVTSQPRQTFKPLTESLQKVLGIRKESMFENSVKRLFYQDKISKNLSDPSAYSASVPSKTGTCSCHITFLTIVLEETAKRIALSLAPVPEANPTAIPTGND
jgi:hypothetical protein